MQSNADKLRALGIPVPMHKTAGQTKVRCPRCASDAKHKNKTDLSVDIDKGVWNCHNAGQCTYSGGINRYTPPEKVYFKPPPLVNVTPLHQSVVDWFKSRLITPQTLLKFKVMDGWKWFHQKKDIPAGQRWAIKFPYFENGELVNIKYRSEHKQFTFEQNAKLVFYNIDGIKEHDWCIITEGEPDTLICIEAGYDNTCSVPNGASSSDNLRLEYLDNCWEAFEGKDKIILMTDDDEAGRPLRAELIRRFGAERCWTVTYAEGCKDINAHAIKCGILSVNEVVDSAKPCPIKGIHTAQDLQDSVFDLHRNGLPPGAQIGIKDSTGEELVSYCGGQMSVITGLPGSGKSECTDQDMVLLAILHGWRFGVYSPENYPTSLHVSKLIEKITGKHFGKKISNIENVTEQDIIECTAFIQDHFYFIIPEEEDISLDNILETARKLVKRFGIKGLLIDPWNTLEHQVPKGENESRWTGESLRKIARFDHKHDTHTMVIAHPAKIEKGKGKDAYPVPTLGNISGSQNFWNMADIGQCYYRDYKTGLTKRIIQKVKHKHQGRIGTIDMVYNPMNGRFREVNSPPDFSNWLKQKPISYVIPAIDFQQAQSQGIITDNITTEDPF